MLDQVLDLVLFYYPDVVADELKGLHGLDEVLLVEILLRVLAVLRWRLLRNLCYKGL